jgi:hypothetical protein
MTGPSLQLGASRLRPSQVLQRNPPGAPKRAFMQTCLVTEVGGFLPFRSDEPTAGSSAHPRLDGRPVSPKARQIGASLCNGLPFGCSPDHVEEPLERVVRGPALALDYGFQPDFAGAG